MRRRMPVDVRHQLDRRILGWEGLLWSQCLLRRADRWGGCLRLDRPVRRHRRRDRLLELPPRGGQFRPDLPLRGRPADQRPLHGAREHQGADQCGHLRDGISAIGGGVAARLDAGQNIQQFFEPFVVGRANRFVIALARDIVGQRRRITSTGACSPPMRGPVFATPDRASAGRDARPAAIEWLRPRDRR